MVLASALVAALMTEPTLDRLHPPLRVALGVCALAFTAEYFGRIWVAGESPRWRGRRGGMLRRALHWENLLDLLALAGIWAEVALGVGLGWAVMLRLTRVLRVFALDERSALGRAATEIARAVAERRLELGIAGALAVLLMMFASVGIYLAEREGQPEVFGSTPRAMWWAVVTLTTVGYGDAVPATAAGKVIGGIAALGSIALIALPAGILAGAFSDALQRVRHGRQTPGPKE